MADHSFEELLATNLYFDNEHGVEAAKIMPGECYVTARACGIRISAERWICSIEGGLD